MKFRSVLYTKALDKLQSLIEELGLDQIVFEVNFGNLIPLENQLNSMRLMMEQVVPNLE